MQYKVKQKITIAVTALVLGRSDIVTHATTISWMSSVSFFPPGNRVAKVEATFSAPLTVTCGHMTKFEQ